MLVREMRLEAVGLPVNVTAETDEDVVVGMDSDTDFGEEGRKDKLRVRYERTTSEVGKLNEGLERESKDVPA